MMQAQSKADLNMWRSLSYHPSYGALEAYVISSDKITEAFGRSDPGLPLCRCRLLGAIAWLRCAFVVRRVGGIRKKDLDHKCGVLSAVWTSQSGAEGGRYAGVLVELIGLVKEDASEKLTGSAAAAIAVYAADTNAGRKKKAGASGEEKYPLHA